MVFGLTLLATYPSWAEEENSPTNITTLESQITKLIESQVKLTDTLQKALKPMDQFVLPDQPQQAGGDGKAAPPSYICTQDYLEWPSSGIYKESEWAMEDMYNPGNQAVTNFTDINGDGLADYTWYLSSWDHRNTCVQLNNGRGWDLAYKCYAQLTNNVWKFYGDCAKTQ